MKRLMFLYLVSAVLLAVSATAENPRDMRFPPLKFEPPEPARFVTDNGIIVYFLEDHQLPVITLEALFKGGSAYDPPDLAGLAEITATVLRTGGAGKRNPEGVDAALDFVGASISSVALNDYLMLDMRALKKDAELGFEILADILQRPMMDSAKIALEKSNRQDAIRRQNDEPGGITRRIFYQTVYEGHPYGRFPTLETVGEISRESIIEQHRKYYNPDNCIMAISGDLSPEELKTLLHKYFGQWQRGNMTVSELPRAAMNYKPGVYFASKDINQAHIRLGHLGIDNKNPDRFALEVLNFALGGGGFTSRLTGQVRTTAGLAYSVGSYLLNRPLVGSFFAFCQTKAESMSQAIRMMLDIIGKVKDSGITLDEMNMAKESIINSYIFNYATSEQMVNARAFLEFSGFPPDQLKKDLEAYQGVTLEDCNRVASLYLDTAKIALIVTGNKALFDKPLESFGPVTEVSLEIK